MHRMHYDPQIWKQVFDLLDLPDTTENREQLAVMVEALHIYNSREAAYGAVWRQYGALSNLLSVARKTDRAMHLWWHAEVPSEQLAIHKDSLDDAYDGINYWCFFIRNALDGNVTGSAPERPTIPHMSDPDVH